MSNAALATLETPDGGTAGSDAPAVRNIKVVVASMLEWKRARGDGELTHWTVEYIEAFLLEDAPRAFATKQELIAGAPDCAASFLGYLSRTGMLTGDPLTQLLACCDERRDELAKAQPRP
jgi:hypothetical protein